MATNQKTGARALILSLAAIAACASAPREEAGSGAATLFPPAKEGIVIPASSGDGDGASILDLCTRFGEVTGMHVMIDEDAALQMQRSRLVLEHELVVPPERVYAVVEGLLRMNDFLLTRVHAGEPWIVGVLTLHSGRRAGLRETSRFVPRGELDTWRDHASFLVTTVVNLPNTDVRTLSNSLRTTLTDANTQQLIPMGSSHDLLIMGFAPDVLALVRTLEELDARGGAPEAAVEAAAR